MGDDITKVISAANDAHQQRNLKADQDTDHDDDRVHQKLKALRVGEGQKQQRRREAAHHSKQQFNPHKPVCETAVDVARKRAADPHGEQVAADDGGELKNAIAEKIACERPRDELVDEPAGGNQQDSYEEKNAHGSVNSGCDNHTDTNGHGPQQDGKSHVVLLHDFFPQVVRSDLVEHEKCSKQRSRCRCAA